MNSLTEIKEFDQLKMTKTAYEDSPRKPSVHIKMPTRQTCRYCGSSHPPRQCLGYEKKCTDCCIIGHISGVCWSKRARVVNEVEQETAQDSTEESSIVSVNLNSISFNKNHSVLIANLKTAAGKNSIKVPFKVGTGSDGNIMPLHTYKKLFPGMTNEQLVVTKMRVYNPEHIIKQQ